MKLRPSEPTVPVAVLRGGLVVTVDATRTDCCPVRLEGTNAFVVSWDALLLQGEESKPTTAQCEVRRDGTFRFLYGSQPDGIGQQITVGVQNLGHGWCYSNGQTNRVDDAMAVSLRPVALDGWAGEDPDGDSISNYDEFMLGSDPLLGDSDGDGPSDRWEFEHGFDPTVGQFADPDPDTDGDLIPDSWEAWLGTDAYSTNSGPWEVKDNDLDGFVSRYEFEVFESYDWDAYTPGPVDEDHVDVMAVIDSTRPCLLSLTGPDQSIDIPWVPGLSPTSMRLRLMRGQEYQALLMRSPTGSTVPTNGFWWANVRFEAPLGVLDAGLSPVINGNQMAYNAGTARVRTANRLGDYWIAPGLPMIPSLTVEPWTMDIAGSLVFCHEDGFAQLALTSGSFWSGSVIWTSQPAGISGTGNPLPIDPSALAPGRYTVTAQSDLNPAVFAVRDVDVQHIGFAQGAFRVSNANTNLVALPLAPDAFLTAGVSVISVPSGIEALSFFPNTLDPGEYLVHVQSSQCAGAEILVTVASPRVYLTFDDGPFPGTDDCISALDNEEVHGTFFMVGTHMSSTWRTQQVAAAASSGHLIANHSYSHWHGTSNYASPPTGHTDAEWAQDYADADTRISQVLGLDGTRVFNHSRLPGKNAWRTRSVTKDDGNSARVADALALGGRVIYGWDVEWHYVGAAEESDPDETAQEIAQTINNELRDDSTQTSGELVLLMHDHMFRNSRDNRGKLIDLIQRVRGLGLAVEFATIDQYGSNQ